MQPVTAIYTFPHDDGHVGHVEVVMSGDIEPQAEESCLTRLCIHVCALPVLLAGECIVEVALVNNDATSTPWVAELVALQLRERGLFG